MLVEEYKLTLTHRLFDNEKDSSSITLDPPLQSVCHIDRTQPNAGLSFDAVYGRLIEAIRAEAYQSMSSDDGKERRNDA